MILLMEDPNTFRMPISFVRLRIFNDTSPNIPSNTIINESVPAIYEACFNWISDLYN